MSGSEALDLPMAARNTARKRDRRREALARNITAGGFLAPATLLFTLFVVLPVIEAAWYSFYRWNGYGTPTDWVGWRNYIALFNNSVFASAAWNTAMVVFVSLLVQLPLALGLALLVARNSRSSTLFRTIFFLPYVLGEVAAGLIWRFVFDGNVGLVAAAARWFGVEPPFILADTELAIYAILVVVVWKYFGFHMMIYIAGLQDIPREMREAAEIDGATRWQSLRHVVLPMLWPAIRISIFFSVVGALQLFDVVMPLTGGGPSNASHTLVTFQYNFGITRMNIGFGSAMGVVLFLACVGFTLVYRRYVMRESH
ncbi:carbohydrate ABC transporter permease [Roseomonas marmotae]|uniref:Sugar ABC transporter permease n=1 Tax=Roseomonas marmotae TaxID=2768161 RepID=A0ABS3KCK4_9PROT|nr:sugar ABC transporter permease [Roseomonas marmotae]MBO1075196.1 sugar ABC transporter permease [Roseomonas marmotae]QTI79696.1 sugar ABC transporter permease [Roseomonas marmotae]